MSLTGTVLPTSLQAVEGSANQLQLFHLRPSIARETLIHVLNRMDKNVKEKRERDIWIGIICVQLDSPSLCA